MVRFGDIDLSVQGIGTATLVSLWVFFVLSAVATAARLYTRYHLIKQPGLDDIWAGISILVFAITCALATVAVAKILHQPPTLTLAFIDDVYDAAKYYLLAAFLSATTSFCTKATVIFFILRFVLESWHRTLLWSIFLANGAWAILTPVVTLTSCHPMEKVWKPLMPGHCDYNLPLYSILACIWSGMVDLALAILPWFAIWNLQMRRKERLLISLSLSLGVFAAIIVFVRAYFASAYASKIRGSTPLQLMCRTIIVSAAESFVTIICVTIPTLRALWLKIQGDSSGLRSESDQQRVNSFSLKKSPVRVQPLKDASSIAESQDAVLGVHMVTEISLSFDLDSHRAETPTSQSAQRGTSHETIVDDNGTEKGAHSVPSETRETAH